MILSCSARISIKDISENRCLFNLAEKGKMKFSGYTLKLDKLRLEIMCSCLTVVIINYWNNLSKHGMESPSLEDFSSRFAVCLNILL